MKKIAVVALSLLFINNFIFSQTTYTQSNQNTTNQIVQTTDSTSPVIFKFKHKKGEASSYISTVEEAAYLNGILNNHAQIINRISTTIEDVDDGGTATLHTNYMTTNNTLLSGSEKNLSWGEESNVTVQRKPNGELIIKDNPFMPTVRNVPVFPEVERSVGQTWTAKGEEVHDVRQLFNMSEPIVIPFVATYKYTGNVSENDRVFNVIEVYYEFYQSNSQRNIKAGSYYKETTGYSKQTLYWDSSRGILDHYNEEFKIQMKDIFGNKYLFIGTAHSEITEFSSVSDDDTLTSVQNTVDSLHLKNINVKKTDKGLTISIENIQFEPDSDILLDSEKEKIKLLSEILLQYPNDLLITGHCAERGTVTARQELSEARAESVANYLINLGIRDQYHIFTQGKGSTQPIATNNTEEGRSKNRRVEITIMDK